VDEDAGKFGNLIRETRILLRRFDCWTVKHVKREGNKAAHTLAKYAVSHPQNRVWLDSFPSCLSGIVFSQLIL
jgi:hypothetical protein